MPHIGSQDLVKKKKRKKERKGKGKKTLTAPEWEPSRRAVLLQSGRGNQGEEKARRRRRAMMILLFKDTINLINLGMPMTNSEVAGPPEES